MQFTLRWSDRLLSDGRNAMKKQIKRFTLVEILMVTGMICLIAALIVVAYNGVYRSWASKNTVATMKAAHLAIDRYMLENGSFPWKKGDSGKLEFASNSSDPELNKFAKNLLQDCTPYSAEKSNKVTVFDDFGKKEPIYYVFEHRSNKTFALMSKGKDGEWGGSDDIIYLPKGDSAKNLKSGFYMCSADASGDINGDVEPLAQ